MVALIAAIPASGAAIASSNEPASAAIVAGERRACSSMLRARWRWVT
ncbi:Uncharacterised protein [Vibrio cholerae]|nr:Uncharacterised protein [Vibrio cholerae]